MRFHAPSISFFMIFDISSIPLLWISTHTKNNITRYNLCVSAAPLNEESHFPTKDIHVVRVAHHFQAITINTDGLLRDAINVKRIPNLRTLSPMEAITYAQET